MDRVFLAVHVLIILVNTVSVIDMSGNDVLGYSLMINNTYQPVAIIFFRLW